MEEKPLAADLERLGEQVEVTQKTSPEVEARRMLAIQALKNHLAPKMEYALLQGRFEALQRRLKNASSH